MNEQDSNERLDEGLRAGDQGALGKAFSLNADRLGRIVEFRLSGRLGGRVDVDDVLQEAFLAARQRLGHYGQDGFTSPFLWLRLIVQQTLCDVHRRHLGAQARDAGREIARVAGGGEGTSASMAIHLAGNWTSPSQACERVEMVQQVRSALDGLSETDQEVLALRHFEELTNAETAEVLGIAPKSASIRYVRALRRLREALSGLPGAEEVLCHD